MRQAIIPSCYFPSTVLFVDDNRDFLLNFTLQLSDKLAYHIEDAPVRALQWLNKLSAGNRSFTDRWVSGPGYSPLDNLHTVDINLSAIHAEIFNPHRFEEVSVVVADYAMPEMNGLTLCQQLDMSIKKILLTGQADEKTAISAFNQGLIDRYIQKSDPQVLDLINESIWQCQQRYFQDMSDHLMKMMAFHAPTCLYDENFAEFFKQLKAQYQIVEFYLIEKSGSFLLLDEEANTYCVVVKNQQEMEQTLAIATAEGASSVVTDKLQARTHVPFWMSHPGQAMSWERSLVPAQVLQGQQTYYVGFIAKPPYFQDQKKSIFSYQAFLEKMEDQEELAAV